MVSQVLLGPGTTTWPRMAPPSPPPGPPRPPRPGNPPAKPGPGGGVAADEPLEPPDVEPDEPVLGLDPPVAAAAMPAPPTASPAPRARAWAPRFQRCRRGGEGLGAGPGPPSVQKSSCHSIVGVSSPLPGPVLGAADRAVGPGRRRPQAAPGVCGGAGVALGPSPESGSAQERGRGESSGGGTYPFDLPGVGLRSGPARAREDGVQPGEGVEVEVHLEGPKAGAELLEGAGPDDGSGDGRLGQQPGQGHVGRLLAELGTQDRKSVV